MSQPDQQEHHTNRVELDPLLAFNAEPGAPEPPETPVDSGPVAASPPPEDVSSLKRRLDQAERSLDRAFTDIGLLKSDLATLVTTIDDIRKRQSRKPEPAVAAPTVPLRPRGGAWKIAAVVILFVVLGAAATWGVRNLTHTFGSGELEVVSATPQSPLLTLNSVTPHSPLPTPNLIVQAAHSAEPPSSRARTDPERPTPKVGYVGTLSIDASPQAEVFINRKPAGRTPLRVEKLRAGSHLVWIERDGYRRWTRVVTVGANRVSRVAAQLDPISR